MTTTTTDKAAQVAALGARLEEPQEGITRSREDAARAATSGAGFADRLSALILQRVASYKQSGIPVAWRAGRVDVARRLARVVATLGDSDPSIRLAAGATHDERNCQAAISRLLSSPPDPHLEALDAAKRLSQPEVPLPVGANDLERSQWIKRRSAAAFDGDIDGHLHELAVAAHAAEHEKQAREIDRLQLSVQRLSSPNAQIDALRHQLADEQARASDLQAKVAQEGAVTARLERALLDANSQLRNFGMIESPTAAIKRDVAAVIDQGTEPVPEGVALVLQLAGDEAPSRALFERVSRQLAERGVDRRPDTVRRWISKYRPAAVQGSGS